MNFSSQCTMKRARSDYMGWLSFLPVVVSAVQVLLLLRLWKRVRPHSV